MASSGKKPRPDLPGRVGQRLARLLLSPIPPRLCVALSGGLDSIVLLHLLAGLRQQYAFSLSALHVHHGLSPHAEDWAQFALATTQALAIPCRVARVEVSRRADLGLEAAARAARYAAFAAEPCDALLLGHHHDDQAETVLLNLLRGSGWSGLAAMPRQRRLDSGQWLCRPLLEEPRTELLAYAQAQGLQWVEDDSNADLALKRNFLRQRALPVLKEAFPAAATTLGRVAAHAAESASLLAELAADDLRQCVQEGGFDLALTTPWSEARRRNALRHWLQEGGVVPETAAFEALLAMMQDSREDAAPCWQWQGRVVRRYRQRLYLTVAQQGEGPSLFLPWLGGAAQELPGWNGRLGWAWTESDGLPEALLRTGVLEVRPRAGGERLRLQRGGPRRLLKHCWQERGVPPWLRQSTPLLWLDGQLAAVPGLGVEASLAGPGWQVQWLPD